MLARIIISLVACLSFLVGLPGQVSANQGNNDGKQPSIPVEVPKKENLNKRKIKEPSPPDQKPQNNSSEGVGEKGGKEESPQTTRASDRSKEVKSKDYRETKTNKNADRKNSKKKKKDSKGKSFRPPISSQKHKKPEKSVHTKKTIKAKKKKHQEEDKKVVVNSSHSGKVKDKSTSLKEYEKALHNRKDERSRSVRNILLNVPPPAEDPTGRKPLQEEGVLQPSSISLQGKTGKDRSQGDSIFQWLLGDLYLHVYESAENHTEIVLRHHRLRTQWMNAPPGEPPKRTSLFL
ncbi:hypothetical protein J0K78_19805 [Halobacillus sp. GSS1]|uniref:hypothetical protein n=1 Tax=Halobacillus sp. GSS1 TaxID=2815919 RepID=UPI001A90B814|nr:hypothetical protein [Halobacillus sp. GSS1]MBN9656518.1 hypothetical protein [Halobacillus sp. GSS1]